jgi:hypothetical protein
VVQYCYEAHTNVPVDHLWPVVADIATWPQSDTQIEWIEVDGVVQVGTTFVLKPKGGPRLSMVVDAFEPPHCYRDICLMPLGQMKTTHEFLPTEAGTLIRVTIAMAGPLGRLWWYVVGRKHAQGLPAQTERFIRQARNRVATDSAMVSE